MNLPDYDEYTAQSRAIIPEDDYPRYISDAYDVLEAICTSEPDEVVFHRALILQAEYLYTIGGLYSRYGIKSQRAGEIGFDYSSGGGENLVSPISRAMLVVSGCCSRAVPSKDER